MSDALRSGVDAGLKQLKLSTVRRVLDDHLRLSEAQSLSPLEFLNGLIKAELRGREESNFQRRMKAAKFPVIKRLEEFDYSFQPSLSQSRMASLRDCRWLEDATNLVFAGPAGVGKSHCAIGLGVEAIERGYKVYFTTVADLLDTMSLASAAGQLLKLQQKLLRFDGLILDELGYVKISRAQGNFLFRLISKAYEHTSIIITTNKDFSAWAEIFEDQVQVSAMLDRLLHHCVIFSISGESYRIKGPHREVGNSDDHS